MITIPDKKIKTLSIMLKTTINYGDHIEVVWTAYSYKPGETVEELIKRIELDNPYDVVEIRLVRW